MRRQSMKTNPLDGGTHHHNHNGDITMSYKADGTIHKIYDTEQKSATFQAREFVIEIQDGQYPQLVKFQLAQDKCNLIDGYVEGEQVSVDFDLRGREWNGKYFTNLQAWRVGRVAGEQASGQSAPAMTAAGGGGFDDPEIPFAAVPWVATL